MGSRLRRCGNLYVKRDVSYKREEKDYPFWNGKVNSRSIFKWRTDTGK